MNNKKYIRLAAAAAILILLTAETALAASNDEIQVHEGAINKPGEFGLDLHTNYVNQRYRSRFLSSESR